MKSFALLFVTLSGSVVLAQQSTGSSPDVGIPPASGAPTNAVASAATSIFGGLLEHNYFNVLGYVNGLWAENNTGNTTTEGFGISVGGGADLTHSFKGGGLVLTYRGDYRDYQQSAGSVPTGTDQSVSLSLSKRFAARWTLWTSEFAGIVQYGGLYYNQQSSDVNAAVLSPFSATSKFLSAGIGLSYQQTHRLSYSVGTNFFLNRYDYGGPFGTTGGSGWVSASYRLARHTNLSGTLSYGDFLYQRNAGRNRTESVFATLSHTFTSRWYGSVSGGVNRTATEGTLVFPITFKFQNQVVNAYIVGPYRNRSYIPYFQGTLTRALRGSSINVNVGESVIPGNGFLLASRNIFVNAFYSRALRRSNFSAGTVVNRYNTVSNTANSYTSAAIIASYAYTVGRHIGVNVNYAYVRYGYAALGNSTQNQIGFGVFVSSRTIPISIY